MTTQHDALAAISERKIITTHVHPPIPYRGNDWSAYFDDEGAEAGRYGYDTEEAAESSRCAAEEKAYEYDAKSWFYTSSLAKSEAVMKTAFGRV